jgi:hypothetical protein
MAGKYGSASYVVSYDDAPGGTLRNVSAHVLTIGGIKVAQLTEENNPFSQAYQSNIPVGVQQFPDVQVEGFYDTTATTGPHVVFGTPDSDPNGATRTFTVTPGDSKTMTVETRLVDYEVVGAFGKLTRYRATIRQAGLAAWS